MRDGVWILKCCDDWHRVPIQVGIFRATSKAGGLTSTALGVDGGAGKGRDVARLTVIEGKGHKGARLPVLRGAMYLRFFVLDFSHLFMLVTNSQLSMDQRQ